MIKYEKIRGIRKYLNTRDTKLKKIRENMKNTRKYGNTEIRENTKIQN